MEWSPAGGATRRRRQDDHGRRAGGTAGGAPAYVGLELGSPACQLGIGEDPTTPAGPAQRFDLCVYAQDCDAAVELLRGHGVTIIEKPADMPWGERAARVADPGGNRLLIRSRLD